MPRFLVHLEGVDFATTLLDTDDLSTIRGASQAYLFMPERRIATLLGGRTGWQVDRIVAGASIGVFRVTTPDASDGAPITEKMVEEAVARAIAAPVEDSGDDKPLDAVRPHLSFTWAAVRESADYGTDIYKLAARARTRQLQRPTVDIPEHDDNATVPCYFDRRRPAVTTIRVGPNTRRASASVAARRRYGAFERHRFYGPLLDWSVLDQETFEVTQSLQDVVDPCRTELDKTDRVRVPLSLASKFAVIYLDGNKFTAIRESTVFGAGANQAQRHINFDRLVKQRRAAFLTRIVECLSRDGRHNWVYREGRDGHSGKWRLRFETLLWGGDEVLFVLPAWALMDVLPELMTALEGWDWEDGYTLSHAVGVAVCNLKTPIAVARKLGEDIANESKKVNAGIDDDPSSARAKRTIKNLHNVVSLQIFESVEPPHEDLAEFRQALYGTKAPEAFTLFGATEVGKMLQLLRGFRDEQAGLPRSQLYNLLAEIRTIELDSPFSVARKAKLSYTPPNRDDASPNGDDAPRRGARLIEAFESSHCKVPVEALMSPALGYTPAAPLLSLIRLAELWDYVDPFGRRS